MNGRTAGLFSRRTFGTILSPWLSIAAALLFLSRGPAAAADPPGVLVFAVHEVAFRAVGPAPKETPLPEDLLVEAELVAPSGAKRTVPLFWDGGEVWKLRFAPDEPGTWRYFVRTPSPKGSKEPLAARAGLDGQQGSVVAKRLEGAAAADWKSGPERFLRHGPVGVDPSGTHFAHRDGAPFLWIGDTVWCSASLTNPR